MIAAHLPVLADEVERLAADATRVVDATAGFGGHTVRLRDAGAQVLAIDQDAEALDAAKARVGDRGITWMHGRFADPPVMAAIERFRPDLVLLDLGVSSHQLDTASRGFSFRPEVPLDMRMDPNAPGPRAADILSQWNADALAAVFREYADERHARRLAREIVRRRARAPFVVSDDLVNAIRGALGPRTGPADFARLFQAIRIAVNEELEQLAAALPGLRDAVIPGGRLAVISYHSGEDRIVKTQFREWSRDCICPPRQPVCTCRGRALGRAEPSKPIVPSEEEVAKNPRARSAKLRVFRTVAAS